MDYQLTPNDLKEDTEYYIEFQNHYESVIKYNGTYVLLMHTITDINTDVVHCTFKNIENNRIISLVYSNYRQKFLRYFNIEEKYIIIDCSVTEITSEYVLK